MNKRQKNKRLKKVKKCADQTVYYFLEKNKDLLDQRVFEISATGQLVVQVTQGTPKPTIIPYESFMKESL